MQLNSDDPTAAHRVRWAASGASRTQRKVCSEKLVNAEHATGRKTNLEVAQRENPKRPGRKPPKTKNYAPKTEANQGGEGRGREEDVHFPPTPIALNDLDN